MFPLPSWLRQCLCLADFQVPREFAPTAVLQSKDSKWQASRSFFADCPDAYSGVAKCVFELGVFQKPYIWFILHQALHQPAAGPGAAVALEDGVSGGRAAEKAVTYAEFAAAAISLAEQLAEKPFEVGRGSRLGILIEKGVDWLIAIAACNLLGAPFTALDARHTLLQRKHVW